MRNKIMCNLSKKENTLSFECRSIEANSIVVAVKIVNNSVIHIDIMCVEKFGTNNENKTRIMDLSLSIKEKK